MSLTIAERIDRLESCGINWDPAHVRSEARKISIILNGKKCPETGENLAALKERVRVIVAQAYMSEPLQSHENIIVKIVDVARLIFLSACWALFVFYTLHLTTPIASFPSLVSLVITLHMVIQGV
jgi:hypothetical protein